MDENTTTIETTTVTQSSDPPVVDEGSKLSDVESDATATAVETLGETTQTAMHVLTAENEGLRGENNRLRAEIAAQSERIRELTQEPDVNITVHADVHEEPAEEPAADEPVVVEEPEPPRPPEDDKPAPRKRSRSRLYGRRS